MAAQETKFEGWVSFNASAAKGNMQWQSYEPKKFQDTDIDIDISHCGVCGSDIHTLNSGWGPTDYPCVVGHEMVGKAIRVGSKVTGGIKVDDRVGVGAQSGACLKGDCPNCANGQENYCTVQPIPTYNSKWPSGEKVYGGYAKYWRGDHSFVIPTPEASPSAEAAPMLCGGVTLYSPLERNGCGPGKRVGIVGIGGASLGHFGLLWAKALSADKVVAISRTDAKKGDAMKLGADNFIATAEEGYEKRYASSLDLIVSTVSDPGLQLMNYLSLLDVGGQFIQVGLPEDPIPKFMAIALVMKRVKIGGSFIGSRGEIKEMLQLATDKNVHPWINERPMSEANQALVDFQRGLPRFRFVLKN